MNISQLTFKQTCSVVAFALIQVLGVAWLDYKTSFEISLSVFYFIPIAYIAWNLGVVWACAFAILCASTLTYVELASGRHYSENWIVAERLLMRLLNFGFVAISFSHFKRTLKRERENVKRLESMFTLCGCCRKVLDEDGNWISFESYVGEKGDIGARTKLCPMCARTAYARGRKRDNVN